MIKRGNRPGDLTSLLSASAVMSETIPPSIVLITVGSVTGRPFTKDPFVLPRSVTSRPRVVSDSATCERDTLASASSRPTFATESPLPFGTNP